MNHFSKLPFIFVAVSSLFIGSLQPLTAATSDAKPADAKHADGKPAAAKDAPKEIVIPLSKFEYDNKKGNDPFFPNSHRWNPPPPPPVTPQVTPGTPVKPAEPPPKKDPYEFFTIKGLTGTKDAKFAVISVTGAKGKNYTLSAGETKSAMTPEGAYTFKVISFTDYGVVIQIEGEKKSKELRLSGAP